jgi:hypothetical protein
MCVFGIMENAKRTSFATAGRVDLDSNRGPPLRRVPLSLTFSSCLRRTMSAH